MKTLSLNTECAKGFISDDLRQNLEAKALDSLKKLKGMAASHEGMTGWINLPYDISDSLLQECKSVATYCNSTVDVIVVVGTGGSYLGAKCALEAFSHSFKNYRNRRTPLIVFAGYSLSEDYMADLLGFLRDKVYALVVISKSGSTLEPALAFRILRNNMLERFGETITRRRIFTITSSTSGALHELTVKNGYRTFSVPENIGGRYSVHSIVGLLPIALGGFDIDSFISGARAAHDEFLKEDLSNPVIRYAAMRNALYGAGKKIEVFGNYHPKLKYLGEWLKQLFAESEGKNGKGLFPATLDFTTDLHSVGQYIQDGERTMFETIVLAGSKGVVVNVPKAQDNEDGLDYLVGKSLEDINDKAVLGTRDAHVSGDVPNIYINIEKIDEASMGQLFYFFELSCAVSALVLGVNPFDQPGVEKYKSNMYKLLGRKDI